MSGKMPEYVGPGRVRLEPGFHKLHIGRGFDSHYAAHFPPQPSVHVAWMCVAPSGAFMRWPRSRTRRFWLRLRGWAFYDGEGRRA